MADASKGIPAVEEASTDNSVVYSNFNKLFQRRRDPSFVVPDFSLKWKRRPEKLILDPLKLDKKYTFVKPNAFVYLKESKNNSKIGGMSENDKLMYQVALKSEGTGVDFSELEFEHYSKKDLDPKDTESLPEFAEDHEFSEEDPSYMFDENVVEYDPEKAKSDKQYKDSQDKTIALKKHIGDRIKDLKDKMQKIEEKLSEGQTIEDLNNETDREHYEEYMDNKQALENFDKLMKGRILPSKKLFDIAKELYPGDISKTSFFEIEHFFLYELLKGIKPEKLSKEQMKAMRYVINKRREIENLWKKIETDGTEKDIDKYMNIVFRIPGETSIRREAKESDNYKQTLTNAKQYVKLAEIKRAEEEKKKIKSAEKPINPGQSSSSLGVVETDYGYKILDNNIKIYDEYPSTVGKTLTVQSMPDIDKLPKGDQNEMMEIIFDIQNSLSDDGKSIADSGKVFKGSSVQQRNLLLTLHRGLLRLISGELNESDISKITHFLKSNKNTNEINENFVKKLENLRLFDEGRWQYIVYHVKNMKAGKLVALEEQFARQLGGKLEEPSSSEKTPSISDDESPFVLDFPPGQSQGGDKGKGKEKVKEQSPIGSVAPMITSPTVQSDPMNVSSSPWFLEKPLFEGVIQENMKPDDFLKGFTGISFIEDRKDLELVEKYLNSLTDDDLFYVMENLKESIKSSIDDYYSDKGKYPDYTERYNKIKKDKYRTLETWEKYRESDTKQTEQVDDDELEEEAEAIDMSVDDDDVVIDPELIKEALNEFEKITDEDLKQVNKEESTELNSKNAQLTRIPENVTDEAVDKSVELSMKKGITQSPRVQKVIKDYEDKPSDTLQYFQDKLGEIDDLKTDVRIKHLNDEPGIDEFYKLLKDTDFPFEKDDIVTLEKIIIYDKDYDQMNADEKSLIETLVKEYPYILGNDTIRKLMKENGNVHRIYHQRYQEVLTKFTKHIDDLRKLYEKKYPRTYQKVFNPKYDSQTIAEGIIKRKMGRKFASSSDGPIIRSLVEPKQFFETSTKGLQSRKLSENEVREYFNLFWEVMSFLPPSDGKFSGAMKTAIQRTRNILNLPKIKSEQILAQTNDPANKQKRADLHKNKQLIKKLKQWTEGRQTPDTPQTPAPGTPTKPVQIKMEQHKPLTDQQAEQIDADIADYEKIKDTMTDTGKIRHDLKRETVVKKLKETTGLSEDRIEELEKQHGFIHTHQLRKEAKRQDVVQRNRVLMTLINKRRREKNEEGSS